MKKISSPSIIESAGNKPKVIEEYIGRVNSSTDSMSIAKMSSPPGWEEPGQKPEFDEYALVLNGTLKVESRTETFFIKEGEAVIVKSGEWVRYSTPNEGAEYIAICLPAFSLDTVNRD
tara:strand:+ start:245 stop:598 length:354 start_codon:yes stop_codon:yes gene_type:complete